MSAQGMTYLAATGDDETTGLKQRFARYGYPDIDPEVLMVGGTVVTVDTTANTRLSEVTWGLNAGVGGTGTFDPYDANPSGFGFNSPPSYQKLALPTLIRKYPYRLYPDISSSAGSTDGILGLYLSPATGAFQIYNYGTLGPIDGTSFASPATAGGIAAVASKLFQGVTPNTIRTNVRLGRLQDALYQGGYTSGIFYDITSGNSIGTIPTNASVQAVPTTGWDLATGWGSLNYGYLYNYLHNLIH